MQSKTHRRFHFMRQLAAGGFGSVYLAKVVHDDGFSRLIAVKLLHQEWSQEAEIASRMRDEARLLGRLRHRNILNVIDLTSIDGRCAILMEFVEGVDFRRLVEELSALNQRVPLRVALEVGAQVADALDAAYHHPPYPGEQPLKVIHRDIKPSNIMMDASGDVRVLDFGIASAEFESRESETRDLTFGSIEYMAPERLFYEPSSDKSDIYSLGATLFEILSGTLLGKAKVHEVDHIAFVAERLNWLSQLEGEPDSAHQQELRACLTATLAYLDTDRPDAAPLVKTLRTLARQCPGPSTAEWAVGAVPAFVEEARTDPETLNNALVGKTLLEDGIAALVEQTNKSEKRSSQQQNSAQSAGRSQLNASTAKTRSPADKQVTAYQEAGASPAQISTPLLFALSFSLTLFFAGFVAMIYMFGYSSAS